MKKTILVTATNHSTKDSIRDYLNNLFSEYAEIDGCLVSDLNDEKESQYDLIVLPGQVDDRTPKRYIGNQKIIFTNRTFDYNKIDIIFDFEPNIDVYFVNDNKYTTSESIEQLNDIGLNHVNIIPYYPGCKIDKTITNAVTAGEAKHAPDHIEKIIDLGNRLPNISDISNIANKLNVPIELINTVTQEYLKSFANIVKNSNNQIKKLYSTQQILKNVFNSIQEGVCLVNSKGIIKMTNDKFKKILSIKEINIINKDLSSIFNESNINIKIEKIFQEDNIIKNRLNKEVLISSFKLYEFNEKSYLIYVNYTDDINKREFIVRKKSDYNDDLKKYSFKDYITNDKNVLEMLNKARKISRNSACVLIQGESGTGKEILAQSIHYSSARNKYPFVPVNFAAINPNLLDSELFGYAEGSFTGASKGGSKGLLEMAHEGTIFFDEIGDAPLSFQVRLLRVLEEKEIRKVGSSERIPIDIRVIAASNKDIFHMVSKGKFREDLFYRINVMPIDTIAIRDRKIDIPLVFNHFINIYFNEHDIKLEDICTKEVIDYFMEYGFKGNIREIRNLVEYFSCIKDTNKIDISQLPKYMLKMGLDKIDSITEYEYKILTIINSNPKIGRYKIYESLKDSNKGLSESKIRTILEKLEIEKYIVINSTRGGNEITFLGRKAIEYIKNKDSIRVL